MNTRYLAPSLFCAMLATLPACKGRYEQLQAFAVVSTHHVDLTKPNAELARGVEGTAKTGGQFTLEQAIDNALSKVPGGTVLLNVTVLENTKQNTLMVRGDVWGPAPAN